MVNIGEGNLYVTCIKSLQYVGVRNFVINEFNLTFEVQNMGNKAFQNASFGTASFPNEALDYSCLWA